MRLPALACLGALLIAVPARAQDAGEIAFWESVRDSKNPAELQAYLDAYPQGKFAALARVRIGALGGAPNAAPAASVPATGLAPTAPAPGAQAPAAGGETPVVAAAPWREFSSGEGGFTALFPGEPKQDTNPPDQNGHSQHRYAVNRGDTGYMISYDDYAPGRMQTDTQAVLARAQAAVLKAMGGTLRSEQPLTLAGLPGREIVFDMPDHTAGRVRVYVGHDRLYQVWFAGPAGQEASADTDRFFDSVRLAGAGTAETPAPSGPAPGTAAAEQPPAPAAGPTPRATSQWHELRPSQAGFVVELPGEAKVDVVPPEPDGRSETRYSLDLGDTAYIVAVDDYAPGKLANADPTSLLDAAQGAVLKGLNGTLRQRRSVTLGGFPGRELLFDTPDHNTAKVRVYVMRNRLYQTWYLGPSGQETRPEVDRFLDSFRLTGE